jgi:exodeoxyribonuclease VIII
MSAVAPIQSRIPFGDYRAMPAINISTLKELKRSPLHYRHALANPKQSPALTLGTAAHTATLEPERFGRDYAIWTYRTDSGRMSPRTGKKWEEFCTVHAGKTILTEDESEEALAIAKSVRSDPIAAKYLEAGEPEVTMNWRLGDRPCKGRVDWLTRLEGDVLVGLKSARSVEPFMFGAAAARLGYALQWAFYRDGYEAATGRVPRMVEIVVESAAPYAVVVYDIPEDVIEYGRDEYQQLMAVLERCERENHWPGPAETEQVLSLPSWVYGSQDDLSDLGLEA